MSLLYGLAAYLDERGHGTYRETTPYSDTEVGITVENVPQSPPQVVVLRPYGGAEADAKLGYDQPNIQIRVRGDEDPRTSRDRAQAIYDDLHGRARFTLPNGVPVMLAVGLQSGPIPIGRDENGRHEHTLNLSIEHRNVTTNRT